MISTFKPQARSPVMGSNTLPQSQNEFTIHDAMNEVISTLKPQARSPVMGSNTLPPQIISGRVYYSWCHERSDLNFKTPSQVARHGFEYFTTTDNLRKSLLFMVP
ncbi:hypothetical protein PoB_004318400 [Plakobranchus ocellatus]|uniref:Uncharacterized protein n=1 Tax=Plakobranchus ocellatus TaxID=259542 RepID=A0AAV4BE96_9GAST|nr:hypothetical protein PoB_004318400 [Plakobranchus ocellatus]